MDYFKILNLKKEPFSNSPDPAFFFQSEQHQGCLQKLELSLRMRRGLNVVIGDVGTGKTTLCRQLILKFAGDGSVETHLILDPDFGNSTEFLSKVAELIDGSAPDIHADDWQLKERIKSRIFEKGVDQEKTIVLIIDEGQKIPAFCLEALREFLNYETNEYKLLQIVIFAQKEFDAVLKAHSNFADRINLYHFLKPLNFKDTRSMIHFRVQRSSDSYKAQPLFSYPAFRAVYRATGGYPRKIINLCHQCVLAMIIQNRPRADWFLVRSCVRRALANPPARGRRWVAAVAAAGIVLAVAVAGTLRQQAGSTGAETSPKGPGGALSAQMNVVKIPAVDVLPATVEPPPEALDRFEPTAEDVALTVIGGDTIPDTSAGRVQSEEQAAVVFPATVEAAPQTADPADGGTLPLPSILGNVALQRNETLSWMCIKVYGAYNAVILSMLQSANPMLKDPDNIGLGQFILFPGTPLPILIDNPPAWWVKVAECGTLVEAFEVVRSAKAGQPPVRIIPHWNARDGMRFAVVLWNYFYDRASADSQLAMLPAPMGANGTVLSQWGDGAVFFSDPFLGKGP